MLIVPLVAIEIPADVAAELSSATLRACDLALGSARCVLATGPRGSQGNAWVAQVLVDERAPSQFRIDLQGAIPRATLTSLTRTLTFDGSELATHRWSTAGVVVAALVISAESSSRDVNSATPRDASSASAPSTHASPAVAPSAVAAPRRPKARKAPSAPGPAGLRLRLDIGALTGPGVEASGWRAGALARPSLELGRWVFVWTSLGAAVADRSVQAFWWSGAVGVGFGGAKGAEEFGDLGLEARLGWRGDRLRVTANANGHEDSARSLRTGPLLGLELRGVLSSRLTLWLSGESAVLFPRVDAKVGGERVGHLGSLDATLGFGLRVHLGGAAQ